MKLNLGSGDSPLPDADGWVNLDAKFDDSLFPLRMGNVKPDGSVPDQSAETIRASHCLEHFKLADVPAVLAEWMRALKPGGWLKVAVPDFDFIARVYLGQIECRTSDGSPIPLVSWVLGDQTDEYAYHKAIFDEASLRKFLTDAELVNVQRWESEIQDCAALPVSLNLMGQKPEAEIVGPALLGRGVFRKKDGLPKAAERWQVFAASRWQDLFDGAQIDVANEQEAADYKANKLPVRRLESTKQQIRIAAVMSLPRVGFLDSYESICQALATAGIPRHLGWGVYWHHSLSRGIVAALEATDPEGYEYDYILTADYDSFVLPEDVTALATILAQHPEVDAVVPMQIKRGGSLEVLAGWSGGRDLTREFIPIDTGHFGFTLFRRSFFDQMPPVWFKESADENGHWGANRTDADIAFWRAAKAAGLNTVLATRVVLGHGEEVISYPRIVNGKIEKVYQSAIDWQANPVRPEGIGVIA